MPSSDHLRRCLQGFKEPSQSFGTIYSDAIDSSDPNSHLGGVPLPADALGAQRGNPLRVQDLLGAPEALTLGACRLEACLHPLEIGMGNATLARPGASVQVPKSRRFVWDKRQNATEHQKVASLTIPALEEPVHEPVGECHEHPKRAQYVVGDTNNPPNGRLLMLFQ